MRISFIDTHALIWYFTGNAGMLSRLALAAMSEENEKFYVSKISLLEVSIKINNLKFGASDNVEELITAINNDARFTIVDLSNEAIKFYQSLPLVKNHRDPFDRFLISECLSHNLPIISADGNFPLYEELQIIW